MAQRQRLAAAGDAVDQVLPQRLGAPDHRTVHAPAGRSIRSRARRASPSSPARSTNTPSRSWPPPINSSKVIASASRSPASMSQPAWEAPPTSSTSRITSAAARPCCTGSITTPGIHRISCCRSLRTSEVRAATLGGATMPEITIHNPDALGKPLGQYSQITRVKASEFLFIAGQVATDRSGKAVGADDFDAQCRQVFANIEAALKSQGASFANVVEFTTYLVHSQDIAKFMAYRLREFPRLFANGVYPPNTLLIVDRLVQEPFLIEVHTVAAL